MSRLGSLVERGACICVCLAGWAGRERRWTRLFVVLDSGVEEEGDDGGGVDVVPVVGEFGGVAFEEALVHFVDVHCLSWK